MLIDFELKLNLRLIEICFWEREQTDRSRFVLKLLPQKAKITKMTKHAITTSHNNDKITQGAAFTQGATFVKKS